MQAEQGSITHMLLVLWPWYIQEQGSARGLCQGFRRLLKPSTQGVAKLEFLQGGFKMPWYGAVRAKPKSLENPGCWWCPYYRLSAEESCVQKVSLAQEKSCVCWPCRALMVLSWPQVSMCWTYRALMILPSCEHHVAGVGIFSARFSFVLVQIFPTMPWFLSLGKGILLWYCAALMLQ